MQGLVFEGARRVGLHEVPDPTPGPGEVVIQVTASGLCGSDLHYYRADPDQSATIVIGGHEPAGIVQELGPGTEGGPLTVGQAVMVHHYSGCGVCASCRAGWTQMCTGGPVTVYSKHAHGGHAPYMAVSARSLLPLDERLSPQAAAAIGCGTGTAWGGLERLGEVGGKDIVIFGQGPVGHSATMLAKARGARVIAVDLSPNRLEQSRHFGASEVLLADDPTIVEQIVDLTHGGPPLILETSGSSAAARNALQAAAPWARLCVIGLGGVLEVDVRSYLSRQLSIMTSWSMSTIQQLECAEFIADRGLPIDDLFSHQWSIDQAEEAYAEFDKQTSGKAVFVFPSTIDLNEHKVV